MQNNKVMTVFAAKCTGDAKNCLYPTKVDLTDEEIARKAFSRDTVFAEYKGNYRSNDNFVRSNVIPFDCDNDHSEDPDDWITEDDIATAFEGVHYIIHYSRNHLKQKKGRSARPRFHVLFLVDEITDREEYTALKQRVHDFFPYFDEKALDAARFFFGTKDPKVSFHAGEITLNAFLDRCEEFYEDIDGEMAFAEFCEESELIREGSRNKTMHLIAIRLLKRYGDTEEAQNAYKAESERCVPALDKTELRSIWMSAKRFYKNTVVHSKDYIPPEVYNAPAVWETPIPFDEYNLPSFPVSALPPVLRDYVKAVAETTQTSPDMAAVAALALVAVCVQGRVRIIGKADWAEPLNLFTVIIAAPAERKSSVMSHMIAPIEHYEQKKNEERASAIIESEMRRAVLEREKKSLEDRVAKGKATREELADKAKELAQFRDIKPYKLFADDVTAEKLASVLAENNSRAAIVSAEGGIFDILKGLYTPNVNIDTILKGHSGDNIRVDRIGRPSETILHPALTMLLAVQPEVLNGMMSNNTFRGRGLTARFLYAMPKSPVGTRSFDSRPIDQTIKDAYEKLMTEMLEEAEHSKETIELSREAYGVLKDLFDRTEKRLGGDLSEIVDWAGKYVGAVLRIAGLLHYVEHHKFLDFCEVSVDTMRSAVAIGEYFLEHAKAAYSLMGADPTNKACEYLLSAIKRDGIAEFSRRDAMRICRRFKTAESLQPILNRLCEYGYIAPKPMENYNGVGRKPSEVYLTNPCLLDGSA